MIHGWRGLMMAGVTLACMAPVPASAAESVTPQAAKYEPAVPFTVRDGLPNVAAKLKILVGLLKKPLSPAAQAEVVPLRAALVEKDGLVGVEYRSADTLVGRSAETAPAGVALLFGAQAAPVPFRTKSERDGVVKLGPVKVDALTLHWRITQKNPSLVERTLEITAENAQQFAVTFPLDLLTDRNFDPPLPVVQPSDHPVADFLRLSSARSRFSSRGGRRVPTVILLPV